MKAHRVRIQSIRSITHDVRSYRVRKPRGYSFVPGQATEVAIDQPGWEGQKQPFTFTSLPEEPSLEFTIKSYTEHHGVTDAFYRLQVGDHLLLHEVWGAIQYKGPGYFIAGGAGITPFLSIFRDLHRAGQLAGNTLFFANKSARDIILQEELQRLLGRNMINILSREPAKAPYRSGHIDEAFLRQEVNDFGKHFYLCGPDAMVAGISALLQKLGAQPDALVFEQ